MTMILFVTLVLCFIAQKILESTSPYFIGNCALSLSGLREGRWYELLTYQFMHSGFMHLLGNLIGLYFFGRAAEDLFGARAMLQLYLMSGTIGGLLQIGLAAAFPGHFAGGVVGASAGLFGLIAAYASRAPDELITMLAFYILPLTFPAKIFLLIEAAVSLAGLFGLFGNDGIAHAAHLGGMLTGIMFVRGSGWFGGLNLRRHIGRRPTRDSSPGKRAWKRPRKRAEEVPTGEFISREVDPILEKISAHGIHSLTDQERKILEAARNKMAKR
jgi:membrane associated rhomboid family serine protease